jgi:hypothetical protein
MDMNIQGATILIRDRTDPYSISLFPSNALYDEHLSMDNFASSIIHIDVIEGLNYVINISGNTRSL